MKKRDIYERVFNFACRVKKMDDALKRDKRANRTSMNQLVRSASAIGSNLEEANGSQSVADFHAKLRISLKEARESYYWLRFLRSTGQVNARRIEALVDEANQIVAILTTIAKKVNPDNPAHHSENHDNS